MIKTFVLIVVLSGTENDPGIHVLNQEFTSFATCEVARKAVEKSHTGDEVVIRAQGCFEK